jgi:hypothetical protein
LPWRQWQAENNFPTLTLGHQTGARRRLRDHPAGDFDDERLPPPQHSRLLRFLPTARQAMDLHGVLWRIFTTRHLS